MLLYYRVLYEKSGNPRLCRKNLGATSVEKTRQAIRDDRQDIYYAGNNRYQKKIIFVNINWSAKVQSEKRNFGGVNSQPTLNLVCVDGVSNLITHLLPPTYLIVYIA